eukprot:CAMPEP_0119360958 /NCGR_PEP_ID=MMETSP1334-20130426/8408_1 /TAXON_ID=127549 /ORGANISM="Calcidiscus leptoporus, Strain RCC1130" /LENGTH=97 /DNA_ID=CAMNT_0007375875 /DNA_START=1 /DNA_END=290 /DNA_ORIENTATION=+
MTRARAGISSSMAVPKKVAQKARGRLKKAHEGRIPQMGEGVSGRLHLLESAQRQRRRHHLTKQLGASMKKAKLFLVRKLVRKIREEREQRGDGEGTA